MRRREKEERESAGERDGTGTAVPWGKGGAGQTPPGQIQPSGGADTAFGGGGQTQPSGVPLPPEKDSRGLCPCTPQSPPTEPAPYEGRGGSFK